MIFNSLLSNIYIHTEMTKTIIFEKKEISLTLQCPRCGRPPWNYTGKNPYVASCPFCKTTVSIQKHRVVQTGLGFPSPGQCVTTTTAGTAEELLTSQLKGGTTPNG
jgi:ribosomal protein L37E